MPEDSIEVHVAHISAAMRLDKPDAIHPVGLSHLGEYLGVMYGEEVPHNPMTQRVTSRVLGSLASLSTNEALVETFQRDPIAYIPQWLKSFSPVVDTTHTLGKYVDRTLSAAEEAADTDTTMVDNDLTYSLGLFDVSSFIIAQQLELAHPRYELRSLMEQSETVTSRDRLLHKTSAAEQSAFELLLHLPIIRADYRKNMERLRRQGTKIIAATEPHIDRLDALLNPEQ